MNREALEALREKVEAVTNTLPIDDIRRAISYSPEDGKMYWKIRASYNVRVGSPALSARKSSGHLSGFYKRVPLQAHRVAWAIYYGEWPAGYIDHINGKRDDNRISNLRVVNQRDNAKNRRPNKGKRSRLPHGVSLKKNGRYFAQIQADGKNNHLGYFDTPEEAKAAYDEARIRLEFHENHGRLSALLAEGGE